MSTLPKRFERFLKDYPEIAVAYETLGDAIHKEGSLTEKERTLVKLAISAGAKMEGAVHAQVRKAIKAKLTKKEIRQVALLSIPTIGFPASMAVMSWMDDILTRRKANNILFTNKNSVESVEIRDEIISFRTQRIIALWGFSEAAFGGILHALKFLSRVCFWKCSSIFISLLPIIHGINRQFFGRHS